MKVLQLTKKVPFSLRDGEAIAVSSIARGLANHGAEVHLLSFNTVKHYYKFPDNEASEEAKHYSTIQFVDLDNRPSYIGAFVNIFSNEPYHITRFVSQAFEDSLTKLLINENYDIVQIESIFLMSYFSTVRRHSNAKIVLRTHNVEFEIWESLQDRTNNIFKSWYLKLITKRLKRYELEQVFKPDLVAAISSRDLITFSQYHPFKKSIVISPTVQLLKIPKKQNDHFVLGFIGSLDWQPNIDGLMWFIEEVLPQIRTKLKQPFTFKVTGRNAPKSVLSIDQPNIEVVNEVADATDFIQSLHLMIVPLFSGSGVRIKILESMAYGTPVLSTTVGFSGLDVSHAEQIIEANDVKTFCDAIVQYSNRREDLNRIANNAQELIKKHHNQNIISSQVYNCYQELLAL